MWLGVCWRPCAAGLGGPPSPPVSQFRLVLGPSGADYWLRGPVGCGAPSGPPQDADGFFELPLSQENTGIGGHQCSLCTGVDGIPVIVGLRPV